MSFSILLEQLFNGFQYGMLLFLMAIGVTLVFGVMRLVNLAHGSMFMVGGYLASAAAQATGSFWLAALCALVGAAIMAAVIEILIVRPLYRRGHLDQLLATFGVTLTLNELIVVIWGRAPVFVSIPDILDGHTEMLGFPYPVYRLAITGVAILAGLILMWLVAKTRFGMLVRAGADNRTMVAGLGVNVTVLYTLVFALAALLAALAGMMSGPLIAMQPGVGDPILILTLTVVCIGGFGSLKGALVASLLVGLLDTFGRIFAPQWFGAAGNALANMLVYILMAAVLYYRPAGLFTTRGGHS
ncbi:branched-chain amino acid ABC transporter permease [Pusillimonas sp. DMV24BSW_D]|uniref:branched-chain amino acid ABC transporter permease n=1 Tax=Neopusillimonas aestuarii TaxID=2716226 RepID=UPI00140C32B6|nr:branched-chain amino acid ABC transporter permease [Pusillimonas sp. DMV24BSW_D]QIM48120.1 branched-chain amino acid ABC transporter permease [Pusillimonas sp. DMV24BSW_D]